MKTFLILQIIVLILFPFMVFSQENETQAVLVSLSARPGTTVNQQIDLNGIISNTLSVELTLQNYKTKIESVQSRESFLNSARESHADYGVECLYEIKGNTLHTELFLLRISDSRIIYNDSLNLLLDLDLDFSLGNLLDEMMSVLEKDLRENPPVKDEVPIEPEKELEKEPEKEAEIENEKRPVSKEPTRKEPARGSDKEPDFKENKILPIKFAAGFGPFLTTGEGNKYFPIGYVPQIYGEYRFSLPASYMGLGIHGSANLFEIQGSLSQGTGYLVSLGPEFRLGMESSPLLGMYVRISGGASLLLLKKPEEAIQLTLIPYGSAGLGLDLNLLPSLGLYFEGNFNTYFEKTLFLTGFYPAMGMQIKF